MAESQEIRTRIIGITHRRKKMKGLEARPTKVAILIDGKFTEYDLEVATDELDFVKHTVPVEWRNVSEDEDIEWFNRETCPQGVHPHHCKWSRAKNKSDVVGKKANHVRTVPNEKGIPVQEILRKVPTKFDGLAPGDRVAMILGGSGDRFAAALSNRGERIGASVYRIPPVILKHRCEQMGTDEDDNHTTLATLLEQAFAKGGDIRPFYKLRARDRDQIRVKERYRIRMSAMRDRIACEQRIQMAAEGKIFLNEDGEYPDGLLEDQFKSLMANDQILQGLIEDEERRDLELKRAVKAHPLWDPIFSRIVGCGPRITAGLLVAVVDVRRFWVDPDPVQMEELARQREEYKQKGRFVEDLPNIADRIGPTTNEYQKLQMVRTWQLEHGRPEEARMLDEALKCSQQRTKLRKKAFQRGMYNLRAQCGVHVMQGGKHADVPPRKQFPRQRGGEAANWSPAGRQALYLIAEQFNRRPDSEWGQRLRHNKEQFRAKHPNVETFEVEENGRTVTKTRYSAIHIQNMAKWRTMTQFIDHVYRVWTRIERQRVDRDDVDVAATVE